MNSSCSDVLSSAGDERGNGKEPGEPGDKSGLYLYLSEAADLVRCNTIDISSASILRWGLRNTGKSQAKKIA